jgi:hypothetical protein
MLFLTMQAFAAARQIPDPATRLNVASMVLSSGGPGVRTGVPHGPALCVRRFGTLPSHRFLSRDLTLPPDRDRCAASV